LQHFVSRISPRDPGHQVSVRDNIGSGACPSGIDISWTLDNETRPRIHAINYIYSVLTNQSYLETSQIKTPAILLLYPFQFRNVSTIDNRRIRNWLIRLICTVCRGIYRVYFIVYTIQRGVYTVLTIKYDNISLLHCCSERQIQICNVGTRSCKSFQCNFTKMDICYFS
jgi:hypothetical protein